MTKKVQKELEKVSQKIATEYQPEKIILFGSYAWGNPKEDSDVDLFIIKNSDKKTLEMMRDVRKITFDSDLAMDVLVYTPEQVKKRISIGDFFVEDILNSGKVLYEKTI